MERVKVLRSAIETYGREAQMDMVIEECSELIQAICKYKRADKADITAICEQNIAEEMADVEIMLDQLKMMLQLHSLVDTYGEIKVSRLEKRLEQAKSKNQGEE